MLAFTFSLPFLFAVLAFALPSRKASFAADTSINARGIFDAAKCWESDVMATFSSGHGNKVKIFGDWLDLIDGMPLIYFTADMDVDCDGVNYRCANNPDGQPLTSFGQLDASKVPFFVIPEKFYRSHKKHIKPNSLGAMICNGKMVYGIFGDTNGGNPQIIGEASILTAQTCFPKDKLDGGRGHTRADVLYILFGNQVPKGVGKQTINVQALKALGDKQVKKLAKALRL